MAESQQPSGEFLTFEEAMEVDKALLSSADKFSARLAIYGLRVLKEIARQEGIAVAEVTPEQVMTWIAADATIQAQIETDANFEAFFTRLVVASLKPLRRVAREANVEIETLTVQQVVAWFEKEAKARLS